MIRVYLVFATHEIELPNHETALKNLDYTNIRIRVVRR